MALQLNRLIFLARGEVLSIPSALGLEVKCVRGDLWITQRADSDDNIIGAGQSFVLDRPGLVLVSALLGRAVLVLQHVQTASSTAFRSGCRSA